MYGPDKAQCSVCGWEESDDFYLSFWIRHPEDLCADCSYDAKQSNESSAARKGLSKVRAASKGPLR